MSRIPKPFTVEEDQMIRELFERQGIKKWSVIAEILQDKMNKPRNAKLCRDRYHRFLAPQTSFEWKSEDQQRMYDLHEKIGNKWAVIAEYFPGKDDNCVKNHFYSKLKKAFRHLNKSIKLNFRRNFKQLKIFTLYKIIEVIEDQFRETPKNGGGQIQSAISLKRLLLKYADEDFEKHRVLEIEKKLVERINVFDRGYKRKGKKERRSSSNVLEFRSSKYSFKSSELGISGSDSSFKNISLFQQNEQRVQNNEKENEGCFQCFMTIGTQKLVEEKEQSLQQILSEDHYSEKSCVQDILKGKNVIYEENSANFLRNSDYFLKRSSSIRSESPHQDMFGDIKIPSGMQKMQDDAEINSFIFEQKNETYPL